MGSVRTGSPRSAAVLHRSGHSSGCPGTRCGGGRACEVEIGVLDIVYLLGTVTVFALTAWIGKAVGKL
jgi:hypothetical protein